MKALRIGALDVLRVEEMIWPIAPTFLFPDRTPEEWAPHLPWLVPRFSAPDGTMRLSIHAFVVRTPHHTVLVDTCVGNDKPRAYPEWDRMRTDFLARLRAAGVAPEQVDYVFCTHLHGDHVGWNTRLENGHWVPTFPKARYLFHRPELEHWLALPDDQRPVQVTDSVLPIVQAGLHTPVDGDFALDDAVYLEPTPGHTPGHCSVHLRSQGAEAVITGDMIHHPVQVAQPHWGTRACTDPARANETRAAFLHRYVDTAVQVLGTHFAPPTACRVVSHGDGLRPQFAD